MMVWSMIAPLLTGMVVVLYVILLQRFLSVRAKLPLLGLRGGLGRLEGKKRWLALLTVLFFAVCIAGRLGSQLYSPSMLMAFHYEEAARGQNPNITRFNESNILSDTILEKVIERGGLELSAEKLAEFLSIATPLDAEKLDTAKESDLKISTEYWVHCSDLVSLYHTSPKAVLEILADVYWEDFVLHYAENDDILDLSFEDLEGMEYLDVKDYLKMQANKLKNYLPVYSSESSSFRAADSEETFSSLSEKITNFIEIELERYEAFILENGLSRNQNTYQLRMQYANRLLDTDRKKDMAAYDVRIEAINIYNAFMTRFVLIPTYDTDKEFYMSKTKVGVDYFAEEATEHLESATKLVEEIEHNTYASGQVGKGIAGEDAYQQADERIEELKLELLNLSAQCRSLCSAYVAEKRDGYIQVAFARPSVMNEGIAALFLTLLFVVAAGGIMLLEPFYREHRRLCREGRQYRREQSHLQKRMAKEEKSEPKQEEDAS